MIRATGITNWQEIKYEDVPLAEGEEAPENDDITAARVLQDLGIDFDPETQKIVSKDNGEIKPDTLVEDGDELYVMPLEGVDVEEPAGAEAVVDEADTGKKVGAEAEVGHEGDEAPQDTDEGGANGGGGEAAAGSEAAVATGEGAPNAG